MSVLSLVFFMQTRKHTDAVKKPQRSKPILTELPGGAGRLLTKQEVADHYRVSVRTISEWAKKGLIARVKIGHVVRFRSRDLA
jgi:excisionase family DNA binding protein